MNADEEKRIIASTYFDKMNVYRPFKSTLTTGESAFKNGLEGKKVYEDVPCALSSFSGGSRNTNVPAPKVESDYKLFYDPEVHVEKNDTIECWHEGRYYVLEAGKEMPFLSHCELPVKETKKTV